MGRTTVVWAVGVLLACSGKTRIQGAEGQLSTAAQVDFGAVAVFDQLEKELVLENVGRGAVRLLEVRSPDEDAPFEWEVGLPLPRQLVSAGRLPLRLRFLPGREATFRHRLLLLTDSQAAPVVEVLLQGRGVDTAARVSPRVLDFGRIEVGMKKPLALRLENSSTLPTTVRLLPFGAQRGEFQVISDHNLRPGEVRNVDVEFLPQVEGSKRAQLAVTPCSGCADVVVELRAEALEQAVVAVPGVLDMGQVAIDQGAVDRAELRNLSTEPFVVFGHRWNSPTTEGYAAEVGPWPRVLPGLSHWEFPVSFTPGHMGTAQAELIFSVSSPRHPETVLSLRAEGGGAQLCVVPAVLEFPEVPVGARLLQNVTLKHCGAALSGTVSIVALSMSPPESAFRVLPRAFPISLQPGEQAVVPISFEPLDSGPHEAFLKVSSATRAPGVRVTGIAQSVEPCEVEVTPSIVDFGTVPPQTGAVLGVKVKNPGTDVCAIKNLRVRDSAEGAFSLPGGSLDGLVVPPGNAFSFQVAFDALAAGPSEGLLEMQVSHPKRPFRTVALRANVQPSCLLAQPPYLDFGLARLDCPSPVLTTQVENVCAGPVVLSEALIGAGTSDGEFLLEGAPPFPATLLPGRSTELSVRYRATQSGMNLSPLFVRTPALSSPLLVPLLGESSAQATVTDEFIQVDPLQTDVLFIVDNTASMQEEHPKLLAAVPAFLSAARRRGVNLRLAVTTTGLDPVSAACPGGARGGEGGRFFPVDGSAPRVLESATPSLETALRKNLEVGRCANVEQGLEAMRLSLSEPLVSSADDVRSAWPNDGNAGFLRPQASLLLIVVSDEDDHSAGEVFRYVRFLQALKPARGARLYALAPSDVPCATAGGLGVRYAQAARATGGDIFSICAPDFSPYLQRIGETAFDLQARFPLSQKADATSLRVRLDGVPLTSGFRLDAAQNELVFDVPPPAGARIQVDFRIPCPENR